ncbi:Rad52/Rad22 family DNA repair protein [Clostridium nigeriense]|uniref:Rad52/Rad22 family DNA repair protein n=1 Tax=Clostridium nigeriense TaxID=1805470 RepID=UPI003D34E4EC
MKDIEVINVRELEAELKKPFTFEEIEWRIGSSFERNGEIKALALPYVTSRAIMDRLDAVFGLDGWEDEYQSWGNNAQLCAITVRIGDRFIKKWDGAESTDIESVKGGLSNALKRTAVKFGIGRYLYSFDPIWVRCEIKGKTKVIAKEEFDTTLATFYKKQLTKIYGVDIANKYSKNIMNSGQAIQTNNANSNFDGSISGYNNSTNNWSNENNNLKQVKNQAIQYNSNRFNVESKVDYLGSTGKFNGKANSDEIVKDKATNNIHYFQSENVKPKVPGAFLNFIKGRIQATGKEINSILTYYSVKALEELSMEQANDLVAKLG